MAKSHSLRAKLKSADRRRKRRAAGQTSPSNGADSPAESAKQTETNAPAVDVVGILADAVLVETDARGNLRDSAVIAALRAIVSHIPPRSDEAGRLLERMLDSMEEAGVPMRRQEAAAGEMLKLVAENQDPKTPDQFIRYLSLIAV